MSINKDAVIANRKYLINNIEIESIIETFILCKHMSTELYRFMLIEWTVNAYDWYNAYTFQEYLRRIKLEAAKSIIDGWIYTLEENDDHDEHPIISAIVSTGQSHLLNYVYSVDNIARAA